MNASDMFTAAQVIEQAVRNAHYRDGAAPREVNLPIDPLCYRKNSYKHGMITRIDENDAYFQSARADWREAQHIAFHEMPKPDWKI